MFKKSSASSSITTCSALLLKRVARILAFVRCSIAVDLPPSGMRFGVARRGGAYRQFRYFKSQFL